MDVRKEHVVMANVLLYTNDRYLFRMNNTVGIKIGQFSWIHGLVGRGEVDEVIW